MSKAMGPRPRRPVTSRHRTAISRTGLSRPVKLAVEAGLVSVDTTFFDYGCGRGGDLRQLQDLGIVADGWDPAFLPAAPRHPADVVNLGYVANVIEDPVERTNVLKAAWSLARSVLAVAARLTLEATATGLAPFSDGCLSTRDTFQKYYTQSELREWLEATLGVPATPAAPGVFFLFRDEATRQAYLAARYRRRRLAPKLSRTDALFREHEPLLAPLMGFIVDRGRLPEATELPEVPALVDAFGSLGRAFGVIKRVTGTEQWERLRAERRDELLLHFALERFTGRARFSDLPSDLQTDVRDYFGTYTAACAKADGLLFSVGDPAQLEAAMRSSPVGKHTGSALYVHLDGLHCLPTVLRVYEGCARAYIGAVEGANLVKLHRDEPRVSYLTYPHFDEDPHPTLMSALVVSLRNRSVKYLGYYGAANPPILHRKEEMLPLDDTRRAPFQRLTQQEERWGLYEDTSAIGTRQGWAEVLAAKGVRFKGRRLVRAG